MASTHSPIRVRSSSPKGTVGRSLPSILMTATSVVGSRPTTVPLNVRWSVSATVSRSAPSTTWLFVRMYPSPVTMNPEPLDSCGTFCWRCWNCSKKSSSPGGTCCCCPRRCPRCAVTLRGSRSARMETTAGVTRSAIATKAFDCSMSPLASGISRGRALVAPCACPQGTRSSEDAKMTPPTKAAVTPAKNFTREGDDMRGAPRFGSVEWVTPDIQYTRKSRRRFRHRRRAPWLPASCGYFLVSSTIS